MDNVHENPTWASPPLHPTPCTCVQTWEEGRRLLRVLVSPLPFWGAEMGGCPRTQPPARPGKRRLTTIPCFVHGVRCIERYAVPHEDSTILVVNGNRDRTDTMC